MTDDFGETCMVCGERYEHRNGCAVLKVRKGDYEEVVEDKSQIWVNVKFAKPVPGGYFISEDDYECERESLKPKPEEHMPQFEYESDDFEKPEWLEERPMTDKRRELLKELEHQIRFIPDHEIENSIMSCIGRSFYFIGRYKDADQMKQLIEYVYKKPWGDIQWYTIRTALERRDLSFLRGEPIPHHLDNY